MTGSKAEDIVLVYSSGHEKLNTTINLYLVFRYGSISIKEYKALQKNAGIYAARYTNDFFLWHTYSHSFWYGCAYRTERLLIL